MKRFLLIIAFLICLGEVSAQHYIKDYKLEPSIHSHKWLNGSEWAIAENDGIQIKTLFRESKSGKLLFLLEVENHSSKDINIDPDSVFYLTTVFDVTKMYTKKSSARSGYSYVKLNPKEVMINYDTVFIENEEKLMNNIKFLVGLGFLFDSDNLAITRGYSKIDYYKENLLLKNTVYPGEKIAKLMVIDQYDFVEELELVYIVDQKIFKCGFRRLDEE